MRKVMSGWGNYPILEASVYQPANIAAIDHLISMKQCFIPRGLGRSYGDSALAENICSLAKFNKLISFDESSLVLHCEAGISLGEILKIFVPRGYMPAVMPGTSFVTVGGMIASDIHGKNHHHLGSFTDHVLFIDLVTPQGERIRCSRENYREFFYASCGGMGLTGIIISAGIKLIKISSSWIHKTTIVCHSIQEVMEKFLEHQRAPYSVAWIDSLTTGKARGRSLLMLGELNLDKELNLDIPRETSLPASVISKFMNSFSLKKFNALYYHLNKGSGLSSFYNYFFPLDAISNWNQFYGENGFLQYQFVLPFDESKSILPKIFNTIVDYGGGTFLSTLKLFGKGNDNYLSFPMHGYSLALDFKIKPDLFRFLNKLDEIIVNHGGRVYLTKDSRLSASNFRKMYPKATEFLELREKISALKMLNSLQSIRLEI